MTKIKLLKNRRTPFEVDSDKILEGFVRSSFPKDYADTIEEVQIALYVAFNEPVGLGSTFPNPKEFNSLFKYWCANRTKFEGLSNEKNLSKKGGKQ